jgi:hypothetical protein
MLLSIEEKSFLMEGQLFKKENNEKGKYMGMSK